MTDNMPGEWTVRVTACPINRAAGDRRIERHSRQLNCRLGRAPQAQAMLKGKEDP